MNNEKFVILSKINDYMNKDYEIENLFLELTAHLADYDIEIMKSFLKKLETWDEEI